MIKYRTYAKPITKKFPSPKIINKKKLLKELSKKGKKAIRKEIDRYSWKHSPAGLKKSIKAKIGLNSVKFYSRHPGALHQNNGVRAHQMTYLLKAKRPIPLETSRGLIFRWATRRSMGRGGWTHPGYNGRRFFQRGLKKARTKIIRKHLRIK